MLYSLRCFCLIFLTLPSQTIYTYPNSDRANKALIAAKYAGIEVNVPPFNMGVDNKTPEFLAKFPTGKVL